MLKFNDGVTFETTGSLRPERRFDGWYVVGDGMLIPVGDRDDAYATIERIEARRAARDEKRRRGER